MTALRHRLLRQHLIEWLMVLLLLPIGQALAAAHALEHQARDPGRHSGTAHLASCAACLAGASLAHADAPSPPPLAAVVPTVAALTLPQPALPAPHCERAPRYLVRAPPVVLR